jgi:hypothetical protein
MTFYDFIPDFFFRGTKFKCNLCGFKADRWLPRGHDYPIVKELEIIGAGKRFVDCKKCGSSDRDRLVFKYLKLVHEKTSLKSKKLLHVAPEKSLSKKLEDSIGLKITRIDYRSKGYKFTYNKSVISGDVQNLPFDSESYDMVICNHVLEHVENDSTALNEIHRVLKTGGFAILQVPISLKLDQTIRSEINWTSKDKINKLGQFDHLRLYGLNFKKTLKEHRFEPIFWYEKDQKSIKFQGLNPKEFVIIASKSIV